jgi:uncharacterized NAD(P)/FAD-binding protein YdhS
MFERYLTQLRQIHNVTIDLHAAEATDVSNPEEASLFRVHIGGTPGWSIDAHHILFVTGHSNNRPSPQSLAETLARQAQDQPPACYVPQPYPLREHLNDETVPPGCSLAVLGLGLTAIDILLHLTEGRGGTFIKNEQNGPYLNLRYVPSGYEPAKIVGVSPSGMFTFCRPNNAKAVDGTGVGHCELEHRGVFFTTAAIRALRQTVGITTALQVGETRQLDFELHAFPLVVLEMAYVYYRTLFGEHFSSEMHNAVESRYHTFLREGSSSRDEGIEFLLEPIQSCFEAVANYINLISAGVDVPIELRRFEGTDVLETFLSAYGCLDTRSKSPWGHSSDVKKHRFEWRTLFEPLATTGTVNGNDWQELLIAYMRQDHAAAAQGNLRNPTKAACDGVWRDLRNVFSEVADFGGLNAVSQRRFVDIYLRHYNRMSNGIGLEVMSKVLALVEAGLVDVSIGPSPKVEVVPGRPCFRITGKVTGLQRDVEVVVEGRAHRFDPEHDVSSLYSNLLKRGFVRRWRNPGTVRLDDYEPGGLDVTKTFHPVQSDGTVERRFTILGAPVEGVMFFQLSAARPQSDSAILNNVARWANEFVEAIALNRGHS